MRIKFNDKIYRLKEIESGVDSLMELVEEQKYKNGDFVYEDGRIIIVKSYPDNYHAVIDPILDMKPLYNRRYASTMPISSLSFRYATEEEKQVLIDAMRKDGKRWNADKKCVEDIPKPKFKAGDKVKIKDGISSETHRHIYPNFTEDMDEFIGKELTVKGYSDGGFVFFNEDDFEYNFAEDWLEPLSDEPKKGDLAIFWDNGAAGDATIGFYDKKGHEYHYDSHNIIWDNAIKFESKEQYEKILRGEF